MTFEAAVVVVLGASKDRIIQLIANVTRAPHLAVNDNDHWRQVDTDKLPTKADI